MKTLIIVTVAAASLAGAAHAGSVTDLQFLEAARCRGLAVSENLGKLDTASLDALLRTEASTRDPAALNSAQNKLKAAQKEADAADGEKKTKLLAEREKNCGAYLGGAK